MSRVWADRIFRTLLALLAASVLWVVVYEVTVGARYRKNDPTEGASRWALIRAQFADRDFSTFGWKTVLLGPSHFWVPRSISGHPRGNLETRRLRSCLRRGGRACLGDRAQGQRSRQAQRRRAIRFAARRREEAPDRAARPHSRKNERNRHSQRGPGAYPDDRAEPVGQGLRLHRAERL